MPAKDLLGAHDFLSHALLTYKKAVLRFIPAHRVVRKQAVLHGALPSCNLNEVVVAPTISEAVSTRATVCMPSNRWGPF